MLLSPAARARLRRFIQPSHLLLPRDRPEPEGQGDQGEVSARGPGDLFQGDAVHVDEPFERLDDELL